MPDGTAMAPVLRIDDLTVRFTRRNTDVAAVNGVTFSLHAGETLTILGESGSGKSVSLKALMGLLPSYAQTLASQHVPLASIRVAQRGGQK